MYKNYSDKGLQIIGISIDSNISPWKKAIIKDKYTFLQLIDKKTLDEKSIKDLYCVPYNPYAILINSEGIIIQRNIRLNEFKQVIEKM